MTGEILIPHDKLIGKISLIVQLQALEAKRVTTIAHLESVMEMRWWPKWMRIFQSFIFNLCKC